MCSSIYNWSQLLKDKRNLLSISVNVYFNLNDIYTVVQISKPIWLHDEQYKRDVDIWYASYGDTEAKYHTIRKYIEVVPNPSNITIWKAMKMFLNRSPGGLSGTGSMISRRIAEICFIS